MFNIATTKEFYSELARQVAWSKTAKGEFVNKALDNISELEKLLPSGSGFDDGSTVNITDSTGEKLIINANFHHMDEHGYYDGWTHHSVIITPSLQYGFDVRVTGKDKRGIKGYISEQFYNIIK